MHVHHGKWRTHILGCICIFFFFLIVMIRTNVLILWKFIQIDTSVRISQHSIEQSAISIRKRTNLVKKFQQHCQRAQQAAIAMGKV